MPQFTFTVTETRAVTVRYTVEAEDRDEALTKAECGDTTKEETLRDEGVLGRTVYDD